MDYTAEDLSHIPDEIPHQAEAMWVDDGRRIQQDVMVRLFQVHAVMAEN